MIEKKRATCEFWPQLAAVPGVAERTLDEIAAALPEKVRNKLLRNQVTTGYPMDQMVKE